MKVVTNTDIKRLYKRHIDNKMRAFGTTDLGKHIMRVNKKKSQKVGKRNDGEVLDTIVHEASHAKHPGMREKNIRIHTRRLVKKLNHKQKRSYYNLFN